MDELFKLSHKQEIGKHYLTVAPAHECAGYPPKKIEITEEQWDALRLHFATGHNGTGETKLAYAK